MQFGDRRRSSLWRQPTCQAARDRADGQTGRCTGVKQLDAAAIDLSVSTGAFLSKIADNLSGKLADVYKALLDYVQVSTQSGAASPTAERGVASNWAGWMLLARPTSAGD